MTRIVIVQGHPDPAGHRLCHSLAAAYAVAATAAGHNVQTVDVARLSFPLLRCQADFEQGAVPAAIAEAQAAIQAAEHLLIVYPLWLGGMPALLKAFWEQVFRPGFAAAPAAAGRPRQKLLRGRSARIVVTMGMPAWAYRWIYRAHSLRSLERNVLAFAGIGPIRHAIVGTVDSLGERGVKRWTDRLQALGRRAR